MKLLIPAYDASLVSTCLRAVRGGFGPKLAVILNPDSGPGARRDAATAEALRTLRAAGAEVWLYIDAVAGKDFSKVLDAKGGMSIPKEPRSKTGTEILREVSRYLSFYGNQPTPTGWFMDDSTTAAHRQTVRGVLGTSRVVWNPGNPTDAKVFDISPTSPVVVWEAAGLLDEQDPINPLTKAPAAVLALNEPRWQPALQRARQAGAAYFFATDVAGNPWSRAPSYWAAMLKAV